MPTSITAAGAGWISPGEGFLHGNLNAQDGDGQRKGETILKSWLGSRELLILILGIHHRFLDHFSSLALLTGGRLLSGSGFSSRSHVNTEGICLISPSPPSSRPWSELQLQTRAIWRCPNPNSNRNRRTSFAFRMDDLLAGTLISFLVEFQCRVSCPALLSLAVYLWNSFRSKPNAIPFEGTTFSPSHWNRVRFHTGMRFGITPEWCSASDRNRVHLQTDSAMHRLLRGFGKIAWVVVANGRMGDKSRRSQKRSVQTHSHAITPPFAQRPGARDLGLLGLSSRVSSGAADLRRNDAPRLDRHYTSSTITRAGCCYCRRLSELRKSVLYFRNGVARVYDI
jgi:hypothetical protein